MAVGLLASLALATTAPAQATNPEAAEWIRPEEVPARADILLRRLDEAGPDAKTEASIAAIEAALPAVSHEVDGVLERAAEAMERSASPSELEDLGRELLGVATPLAGWRDALAAETKRVADVLDVVDHSQRLWSETRARPEIAAAGDVVARRIETALAGLGAAGTRLRVWRVRIIDVSDRVIERIAAVDQTSERLRTVDVRERDSLLVPNRPPLWSGELVDELRRELPQAPAEIVAYAESTIEYVKRDPRPLIVQALMAATLMLLLGRFSSRALVRLAGDATAARAARVLERPYATGLLLALIATPVLHPLAPRRVMQLGALVAIIPAARLIANASGRSSVVTFVGLFSLLLLDRFHSALLTLPVLERGTFMLTLGMAFWLAVRLRRRAGDNAWLALVARLAMAGLVIAMVAEVGGWTNLAALLGRGIVAVAISTMYVHAAIIALSGLLAYVLASPTARRSRLVERDTAFLQEHGERVLRALGIGLGLYFVTMAVGLRGAVGDAAAALFGAGISIGALSLSIGGILAFVVTVVGALLMARAVTAVLDADVFPRTRFPRGVPYAVATLVRYGIYGIGFLFALGAAGVRLDQVSIMLGGLGIGIGLGLQDLVKNFAAGLTLLIERRLGVGDAIELPAQQIVGRVISIGTRASVVRSWSGAEIVVPNDDLVSNPITNWTLSDRLCRIEVPVGVAYGTDPEQVIKLLAEAARGIDRFLRDPPPEVFFKGFGSSSLDFVVRAWADEGYEHRMSLTSRLGLAMRRTLHDAGIAIPFPQHDLHLESVSPAAGAALSAAVRRGEPQ